jgi:hypothetical protein
MITSRSLNEVRSVVNHLKTSLAIVDMQKYIKSIVINQKRRMGARDVVSVIL